MPPKPKTLPDRSVEVPRTRVPPAPGGLSGPPVPDTETSLPPKGKTRADWKEEEYRRTIAQHGKYVIWRKAMLCPCHDSKSNQASINCTLCDGSGFYYVDPIAIQVLMMQFDKDTKIFEKFGMWNTGACSVTSLPEHRFSNRDSIEMRDSVMVFEEILTKGNRRGIRSKLPTGVDSARYRIVSATRLVSLLDGTLHNLESGVHFEIDDNGWIEWLSAGNSLIPDGSKLSIRYEFHPVWVITSFPFSLRDDTSGRKSPKGVDRVISHPLNCGAQLDFLLDVNTENVPVNTPVTGSL